MRHKIHDYGGFDESAYEDKVKIDVSDVIVDNRGFNG